MKDQIEELRNNEYYTKLLEELVLDGLLDIISDELEDGKIDYLPLIANLLTFLNKNKKKYRNFSSRTFENIIILTIDEILTKKFNLDLDEKQIENALNLVKNSFLVVNISQWLKDRLIIFYYDYLLNISCCKSKEKKAVQIINNI